jgi:hypothetical protein
MTEIWPHASDAKMNDLITVITSAGVSALLTAVIVFLAKNWISERLRGAIRSEYEQKLETHKAQLKAQNDTQLEHFKAQLQVAASERSIRLTRVFETTVDTVAGTYERFLAFHDAVGSYISIFEYKSDPSKEERRKIVASRYTEFLDYYRPRRPFLPKRTVLSIEDFCAKLHKITVNFMIGVEQGGDERRAQRGVAKDKDTWIESYETFTEEIPPILALLEDDLRKILETYEEAKPVVEVSGPPGAH